MTMQDIKFVKAVKGDIHAVVAISGPSGSGKTYTALNLATELVAGTGKGVAVADTERGSARLYADEFDYAWFAIDPPYHPDVVGRIIKAAKTAGYGAVIIDSLSHFWSAEGGALDIKDEASATAFKGNSFMAWSKVTPIQRAMFDNIVGNRAEDGIHVIVTMRSKTAYAEIVENGRKRYEKVGVGYDQRDGSEYEFDLHLLMDVEHNAIVDKSRCRTIEEAKLFPKPGANIAKPLIDWLKGSPEARAMLEEQKKQAEMELMAKRQQRQEAIGKAINASHTAAWAAVLYDGVPEVEQAFKTAGDVQKFRAHIAGKDRPYSPADNVAMWRALDAYVEALLEIGATKEDAVTEAMSAWFSHKPKDLEPEPVNGNGATTEDELTWADTMVGQTINGDDPEQEMVVESGPVKMTAAPGLLEREMSLRETVDPPGKDIDEFLRERGVEKKSFDEIAGDDGTR